MYNEKNVFEINEQSESDNCRIYTDREGVRTLDRDTKEQYKYINKYIDNYRVHSQVNQI